MLYTYGNHFHKPVFAEEPVLFHCLPLQHLLLLGSKQEPLVAHAGVCYWTTQWHTNCYDVPLVIHPHTCKGQIYPTCEHPLPLVYVSTPPPPTLTPTKNTWSHLSQTHRVRICAFGPACCLQPKTPSSC